MKLLSRKPPGPDLPEPAQTCIMHLLRHSMSFASYKDRKAAALKAIYTALDAIAAQNALAEFEESDLAAKYPAIAPS